jgi:hypothetical protein
MYPDPQPHVASLHSRKIFSPNEPEKIATLPEDEGVMPENKPEKNLKIQVCSVSSVSVSLGPCVEKTFPHLASVPLGKQRVTP